MREVHAHLFGGWADRGQSQRRRMRRFVHRLLAPALQLDRLREKTDIALLHQCLVRVLREGQPVDAEVLRFDLRERAQPFLLVCVHVGDDAQRKRAFLRHRFQRIERCADQRVQVFRRAAPDEARRGGRCGQHARLVGKAVQPVVSGVR